MVEIVTPDQMVSAARSVTPGLPQVVVTVAAARAEFVRAVTWVKGIWGMSGLVPSSDMSPAAAEILPKVSS